MITNYIIFTKILSMAQRGVCGCVRARLCIYYRGPTNQLVLELRYKSHREMPEYDFLVKDQNDMINFHYPFTNKLRKKLKGDIFIKYLEIYTLSLLILPQPNMLPYHHKCRGMLNMRILISSNNREAHVQAMKLEKSDKTLLALIFIFAHQIFLYKGILNCNS